MSNAPERVEPVVLEDLQRRLAATRRAVLPRAVGWERGTDADYLAELVEYWAASYDWRANEDRLPGMSTAAMAEVVAGVMSELGYVERREPVERVDVPTAVTLFPHDLVPAPRAFGERFFDVRVWDEQPDGGHFGAWERPQAFVDALRAAVELAR